MDDRSSPIAEILEERTEETSLECDVELADDTVEYADQGAGIPQAIAKSIRDDSATALSAGELTARRSRRATIPSQIPSQLALSMKAAPSRAKTREITRVGVGGDQLVAPRGPEAPVPVAALVERACASMRRGEVGQALMAADEAITMNERSRELDVGYLRDIAGGPLAPIFLPGGPLNRVPVVASSERELDAITLDELHWALLRRVDGRRTVDQVFTTTKIPAIDALKIAASLFRFGVIRMDDRRLG